ncbi:response regulator [Mucilaginibacter sp. UR6-1]|uniref:response regulator n=1 Tax=Mucilaginibacter sp. UR6-1 TaxID=1435643 RepID=UPI001E4337B1|nr:response regulator [Mucilaginibacter sp. UR6-1]MCC8408840.1 response regulator [Mucilaginibacter sp. UR6-1]
MRRILAVDDNRDILEIIELILEDCGYEVETLTNGHNLFEKIKEINPDLILLDIMLGDLDGRELCEQVKNLPETSNIPVVLISASHNMAESIAQHKKGAPNAFIAKPFDIDDLVDTVQSHIAA